jgi:hypothetical protein
MMQSPSLVDAVDLSALHTPALVVCFLCNGKNVHISYRL